MSDFQEHLAEAMESEAFSKEYVNELCYRCGDYKEEHLGRCNGCKWRVIRNGDA